MSKKLLNAPDAAVVEMLQGLVQTSPALALLDGLPEIKVVFNPDHPKDKVALISGGGSGHEPAHAGYVGPGMLAAAVCGEVFASPSAKAVLAAIKTVAGPAGCLLVVKNYTGDRLHFGQAAEQAKAEGLQVEMVVVGEDCAIDEPGGAGRRGLAGTVFVHKIAGALAAAGKPLAEVAAAARGVAAAMGTMGVALRVCTLPGRPADSRLAEDEVEVGLGIHGEPGRSTIKTPLADEVVEIMLDQVVNYKMAPVGFEPGTPVALMVNNLGATPGLELQVVTGAAMRLLAAKLEVQVVRVYVGSFMTSLDMAGVSLTLLKVAGEHVLPALDAPVPISAWPAGPAAVVPQGPKPLAPLPDLQEATQWPRPSSLTEEGTLLERCIHAAATAVIQAEAQLTDWDAKAGDGDCGTTLKQGSEAIIHDLQHYPLNDPAQTALALAATVGATMGGTSGALYHMFAAAAAAALRSTSGSPVAAWSSALNAGTQAIQRYGGAGRGDRTMLDALLPAAEALSSSQDSGAAAAAASAAAAATAGAESTRGMVGRAGRASYVPAEAVVDCPDPGAMAVATWLNAVSQAIQAAAQ